MSSEIVLHKLDQKRRLITPVLSSPSAFSNRIRSRIYSDGSFYFMILLAPFRNVGIDVLIISDILSLIPSLGL